MPEETIRLIMKDQQDFSKEISDIAHEWVEQLEVNLEVLFDENPQKHIQEIEHNLEYIEGLLSKIDNFFNCFTNPTDGGSPKFLGSVENIQGPLTNQSSPLQGVLWEERNIGGQNSLQKIRTNLLSLSLHAEIGRLLANPSDEDVSRRVDEIKMRLRNEAAAAVVVD